MLKKGCIGIVLLLTALFFAYFFICSYTLAFTYHEIQQAVLYAFLGLLCMVLYFVIWFAPSYQKKKQ